MTHRTRHLALALAMLATPLTAQGLPRAPAESLGLDPARLAVLDRALDHAVADHQAAGIVVMIARHGKLAHAYATGLADIESGRPMTTDALFRIASQSKAVTSVAIMMLVEEGRVRLEDPVSRWLPGFDSMTVAVEADSLEPARAPITIRQLLTHTAGLSYGTEARLRDRYAAAGLGPAAGWGWYLADKDEDVCTTMDRLATLPLAAQPGERWVYGYATDVLGCVVERASGVPFAEFVAGRIAGPLGMHDTGFEVPADRAQRLATVYRQAEDGGLERAPDDARGQGHYLGRVRDASGGAGLVSSAGDYLRFLQMLLGGGALDGTRLLAPSTVALMAANHVGELYGRKGRGFGLGFSVLLDPGEAGVSGWPGRYGWAGAYGTSYFIDPELDLVAVFMLQKLPRGRLDIYSMFETLVYQAVVEAPDQR